MSDANIAVVIPHFQRTPGLLATALRSVFTQSIDNQVVAIVVDDASPISAASELETLNDVPQGRIIVIEQKNGGAGAARNTALNNVLDGIEFVAFLDSDDAWRPKHLENAMRALETGYDAYFADWWSFNFPEQTNFQRIGSLKPAEHKIVNEELAIYELGVTPIEHILKDGGGLIQTSTVVYRYHKFPSLRFREEFYNGQDFFFWMDLGELGASFVFSTQTDCDNGEGINIYQSAGWGTERSLQRIRNELFVWTSVNKFYKLTPSQMTSNRKKIKHLQENATRDILYRLRRKSEVSWGLIKEIVAWDFGALITMPLAAIKILAVSISKRPPP